MSERFFKVSKNPQVWADTRKVCHIVVTMAPWEHTNIFFSVNNGKSSCAVMVKGRKSWGAPEPIWKNEVIYYNVAAFPLVSTLNKIIIHHTDNSRSIMYNETKQQSKGYAALGYHFFIYKNGDVYEGRPLEIMGSHAGRGKISGPLNDPDWGAIGIVLQGDYHHKDDYFFSENVPKKQLNALEKLASCLKAKYSINQLLMHQEVSRSGKPTVCPGDHLVPYIEVLRKKLSMKRR